MYICVCNAVNDRQIKKALDEGISSIRDLRAHFGFESCCGKCTCYMRDQLIEHLKSTNDLITEGDSHAG